MLKFHDCSNSLGRSPHRGGGGPVVNDVMAQLRQYAGQYHFCHVDNASQADVVITNDVFTPEITALGKPLVKRMDGVFWQREFMGRNVPHKAAADAADVVVFISDYSRASYESLYGAPTTAIAVTAVNWADPNVYFPKQRHFDSGCRVRVYTAATSWDRPEKRGQAIIDLTRACDRNFEFVIVGTPTRQRLGDNAAAFGYVADHALNANIIRSCDVAINLSYRDAAPKTVAQAAACGLPVLYAASGGTPEVLLVGTAVDDAEVDDGHEPPTLDVKELTHALRDVVSQTRNALNEARDQSRPRFDRMLKTYFDAMSTAILTKR